MPSLENSVKIISTSRVFPDKKSKLMNLKLSVSDLPVHYIQQGCLFTRPHLPPQALLSHFKHSLSLTLSHFPPLAGRLSTSDDGNVFLSCNDAGADFVFADAKSVHVGDVIAEIHQNILQITNYISYIKSVSTNYSSSSKSCRSFTDAQTNSPSPVSYPMRIAVSPGKVHQVFLNFRGEQLRYNFVSHLSDAFQRHEIKFFIDKYEQRGKDLKHLFLRIEESSIALAIFSTRYPESSWCMDELVKMKKLADQGELQVIPIFYKVKPEDVRKPTRDSAFGKNFWRLAEASSGDQIKNWKEALECISEKMGLSLGDKSSEADLVKDIVKDVQRVIEAIGLDEEENHDGK